MRDRGAINLCHHLTSLIVPDFRHWQQYKVIFALARSFSLYTALQYIRSMHIKFNDLVRHFIVDSGLRCFAFTHHHQLHHNHTHTLAHQVKIIYTHSISQTYTRFTLSPRLRFYLLSQIQCLCVCARAILKLK